MSSVGTSFDVLAELPALRRYAWTLTRDRAEAEDLVHDALVRAYEGRSTFKDGGDLRSWLFSVLHNTFVSRTRSRKAYDARIDRAAELVDTCAEPEQESRLRLTQIRAAFMSLPEEQRAVLHLVAIEGLPYQEAARTLGIPVGTLMSRLGRARLALRALEDEPKGNVVPLRLVGGKDDGR
ncbi:sigma-70 family RNA polymerase sigma factor [Terrihabitans sp. B22-R8]|uniref:sigma-70 family RNA polymerase sigma factor n=1 Tax=Terrihabitans sp. B22-R8 TaxID=3425128 RepID=UPI00403C0901